MISAGVEVAPSSGLMTCTMPRLAGVAHAEQLDTELGGVLFELHDLPRRSIHFDRHIAEHLFGAGRRGMIDGCQVRSGRRTGSPNSSAR